MKKFQHIITIALTVFFVSSCGGEEKFTVKYYAYYELDGRYSIVGRYEFDPAITPRNYCYKITYDSLDRPVLVQFLKADKLGYGFFPYEAVQTRITYHEDYEIREFLNGDGEPAADIIMSESANVSDIFSIRLDLDEKGNRIALTNLNIIGEPFRDTAGVVTYLWTLDEQGRITKSVGLNIDRSLVTAKYWTRERHYTYDEVGNLTEIKFIGRSGLPCQDRKYGVATIRTKYDINGNVIERRCLDLQGNPVESDDLECSAKIKTYDDWGRISRYQKLVQDDVKGAYYEISTYKYDDGGNLIELAFRDSADRVIDDWVPYSIVRYKYDDFGNKIEETYHNADGTAGGAFWKQFPPAAIKRTAYNDQGQPIETRYYSEDTVLTPCYDGYAIHKYTYTDIDGGIRTEQAFFDVDGRPTNWRSGATAKFWFDRDKHGHTTLHAALDTVGKCTMPVRHDVYDEIGNLIEEKITDEEGNIDDSYRRGMAKYQYDKCGYLKKTMRYDSKGNLHDSTVPAINVIEDCLEE